MVSSYNMHLQIPAVMVPPLLPHKRIIFSQVVFPSAVNIHQIYLPHEVFLFLFFFFFLFFIKTSLVLAGLMVEDQKAIFQLFLKSAFLSKVKQCFSNSLCYMRHLLVSQTCYVSAWHRERPAHFITLKKTASLLGLPKLA